METGSFNEKDELDELYNDFMKAGAELNFIMECPNEWLKLNVAPPEQEEL